MKLTFTHYIDRDSDETRGMLTTAIAAAIESAAERIDAHCDQIVTEAISDGVRIDRGVVALAGSELHVTGGRELTELRIDIPWSSADSGSEKLWAAVRFASVLAEQVALAA